MGAKFSNWFHKESTRNVLSSLISILLGLAVGAIVVLITGLSRQTISTKGTFEGVKLVFFGLFSTGRGAAGELAWGINAANMYCSVQLR